ncbi:MAG: FtsX-like permease family protein [Lachnospiraceae bacterium]|nr:FtsX-like permease family protein [Lachnospiraceae bacterium]
MVGDIMRNPLIKRVPRELIKDWHKYIVIIIFMVLMIGVISGMYVGHDSMLAQIDAGEKELLLEDGSFEITHKASEDMSTNIEKGLKADVRRYFIDKGTEEADKVVAAAVEEKTAEEVNAAIEEAVRSQCAAYGISDEELIREQIDQAIEAGFEDALAEAKASDEYKKAVDEAYETAHEEVIKAVDEKWDEISGRYDLDSEDFSPVEVKLYEHFYRNEAEDNDNDGKQDATVRIFKSDSQIDKAVFFEGSAPAADNEIAIDRMHAQNIGIKMGDEITVGNKRFKVVGLLSYVNYLTLHENNTDLMFDAFGFDVAMLTPSAFDKLDSRIHYNYAYKYITAPEDKIAQADHADSFLKALITQTLVEDNELKDYLPGYLSQARNFAISDIEGDSTTTSILCYILIGVIAFIFAITISNTIEKEASVIGTLRASGYTKAELIRHFMSMPLIVTIFGAVIGNILGYTLFKSVALNLYYQSYSLPPCSIVWSKTALIKTTVIPFILMLFVNLSVIVSKMQISPLRFLRHDLAKNKRSKARRLPAWSFLSRFRLRILFQNMPNYLVLIFGVIFIELMLCFAFGLPDSLNNYGDRAADMVFAEYQYMLMGSRDEDGELIDTIEKSAERFSAKSLMYAKGKSSIRSGMGSGGDESVTVYGIEDNSAYVNLGSDVSENDVYASSAFIKKFDLAVGDMIDLHEEYENKSYSFKIAGQVDYDGGIAVFMKNADFNTVFEKDADDFSGYFSREEITDIDESDIATMITAEDIAKVANQLIHSIGGALNVFKYVLIVLAAALIYLLAKIIIERNEHSISMVKILGFENREIASLYILPTAAVILIFAVLSFFAGYGLMLLVFKVFVLQMDGYFAFYMSRQSMVLSVVYLLIGYAFVSLIDLFRIRRIPLDVALKNVE